MARMLFHDGECSGVFGDAHRFSELELRQFVVVDSDVKEADARAKYMKSGVPPALQEASDAENRRLFDDVRAALAAAKEQIDKEPTDLGKALIRKKAVESVAPLDESLIVNSRDWPRRAAVLDLARLDPDKLRLVEENVAAIAACRADVEATENLLVLAKRAEQIQRPLTADEQAMDLNAIVEKLAKDAANALLARDLGMVRLADRRADEIRSAARAGRVIVMATALADVAIPEPHFLDAAALDAVTVEAKS